MGGDLPSRFEAAPFTDIVDVWLQNPYAGQFIFTFSLRGQYVAMQLELGAVTSDQNWSDLSDSDFLKAVSWKRGTPAAITQSARKGDPTAFVAALAGNWPLGGELATEPPCRAVWSLAAVAAAPRELGLAAALAPKVSAPTKRATSKKAKLPATVDPLETWWLELGAQWPLSMWEYLALLEMFPSRLSRLTPPTAFSIWRALLTVASDVNQLAPMREAKLTGELGQEELARYGFQADPFLDLSLLRNCELPWLAGVVFSAVKGSEKLRQSGAELLEHELVERTDDKGAPHADLLPRLPLWLAVATRILQTAQSHDITLWDADATELYRAFIEKIAPIIQPDGQFALSHVQVAEPRAFAEVVLKTSGWSETEAALVTLFAKQTKGKVKPAKSSKTTTASRSTARRAPREICIAPVNQSDDAAWAVLRTHWGADADRVIVTHDQPAMNIELTIQGKTILAGEWYSEISSGNETFPFYGEWNSVCWQSDDDADYIELQFVSHGVVRAERQILLSRTRQFCFIAESLGDLRFDQFNYRTRLPLVAGIKSTTSNTTREVRLDAGGTAVRVFPVALPDQHVLSTAGRFGADFALQTTATGAAWYNPILIDWSPARRTAPAVWKSLTVAEEQKAVKPDVAAGYRIKVGNHQWLIYRSLQRTIEARSVLGHQTRYETVIGSVESNGDITPLMLVE